MNDIGIILVAGGLGTRMNQDVPKQFIPIKDRPIALYSFEIFMNMPEISELVVVCAPEYRHLFTAINPDVKLVFALPGKRRQDSVYNGLQELSSDIRLVCLHDSARPMLTPELARRVINAAEHHGAATAGIPIKFTIKQSTEQGFVQHTPDRSTIWEIQTPQAMKRHLIVQGFEKAMEQNLTVTDDVSLVELLGHPVKLVEGSHSNIKITTPEDLIIAERLLEQTAKG